MAGLPGSNRAAAGIFAQPRGEALIADPDAEIRLQRAETEIEQDGFAIFLARRLTIGADLRQRGAPVHGAIISRQAKRDPLISSGFGDAFRREGPDSGMRFQGDAATGRHRRNGLRRHDRAAPARQGRAKIRQSRRRCRGSIAYRGWIFPAAGDRWLQRSSKPSERTLFRHEKVFSGAMPKENTVLSGQDKPVRRKAEPAVWIRTSRLPSTSRYARATDRPRSGRV